MANESAQNHERDHTRAIIVKDPLLSKLAMGLFCSAVVTVLMNFFRIKWIILFLFAAVLRLFGGKGEPPPEDMRKAQGIIARVEGSAKKIASPLGGVVPAGIGRKSPEQLQLEADLKEAERRRKEESERRELLARAGVVGLECDEDASLEKLRVEVRDAEHRAEEEAKKKPLYARADKIGLEVDPTMDSKALKQLVEEAEKELAVDADYQAARRKYEHDLADYQEGLKKGPNACCPRCRHPLRFPKSRIGTDFVCSRCGGISSVRRALAGWTPPPPPAEPQPPKKNPGLWKRIFK